MATKSEKLSPALARMTGLGEVSASDVSSAGAEAAGSEAGRLRHAPSDGFLGPREPLAADDPAASLDLSAGLAVSAAIARGDEVDKEPVYLMPQITQENVDVAIEHVVTDRKAFLAKLPDLTAKNLETGDIAYEGIPGQQR